MMKSEEVTRILENAIRIGKGVIRYGSVASYIPELAKADKNKLGICLYTIDGNQFETGNKRSRGSNEKAQTGYCDSLCGVDGGGCGRRAGKL